VETALPEKAAEGTFPLELGEYRGRIAAAYNDPLILQDLRSPAGLWSRPGTEVLIDKRNRVGIVRLAFSSGRPVEMVLKEYSSRGVNGLKSCVLPSKAAKAWRGALALRQRGLATAAPVAYLEKRMHGRVQESFFLAERIEGAEEVRQLFRRLPPDDMSALLASLARHLYVCHDRGILHRDLSDGNVLVRKDPEGGMTFFLLDTNRVRVRKKIRGLARARNLIRLGIPPMHQRSFLQEYFCPRPLSGAAWLWYKMNKAVFSGYIALKKKLRLRRIARKLGIQ
jgi:serine/threonine protein kinase